MTRARQIANFDPALFDADEVSGDKVSGGTIGAGVIGASVTGGAGLSGSTSLGTVTAGDLSHANIVYPAGHIVQVSEVFNGNDDTSLSTAHTFESTVVTGNITPLFDDSSIIINAHFGAYAHNTGEASGVSNPGFAFRWLKTSTATVTANPVGIKLGTNNYSMPQGYLAIDDGTSLQSYNMKWPYAHVLMDFDCETTSQITYTLQVAPYNTTAGSLCGSLNASAYWYVYFMEVKR